MIYVLTRMTTDAVIDATSSSHAETDLKSAGTATLIKEQSEDINLTKYFDMAKNGNKLFFIRDGILYRRGKVQGNRVEQLCLPAVFQQN